MTKSTKKGNAKARRAAKRNEVDVVWPSESDDADRPVSRTIAELKAAELDIHIRELDDGQCHVLTTNVMQSGQRIEKLREFLASLPRPPDIVAIQDPPPKLAFKSFGSYGHWYRAADVDGEAQELSRDNDPSTFPYRRPRARGEPEKKEIKSLCKVAFLIHSSLRGCRVTEAKGDNRGLHATLHLTLSSGHTIAFHNVYNHLNRINVHDLGMTVRSTDKGHVLVADMNLHHVDWGGEDLDPSKIEKKAKDLAAELKNANMECLNDGTKTYLRRENDEQEFASTVDIIYVKDVLRDQSESGVHRDVPGFQSDHRPSWLTVNIDMERKSGIRYLWEHVDKKEFTDFVKDLLQDVDIGPLLTEAAVNEALDALINRVLLRAIEQLVPVARHYDPKPKPMPAGTPDRSTLTGNWHRQMGIMTSGRKGIFPFAKRVHNWSVPRQMATTPDFKVGSDTIHLDHEKADHYVRSTFTKSRIKGPPLKPKFASETTRPDFNNPPPKPEFDLPDLPRGRKQLESKDEVTMDELNQVLKELPSSKATGVDGVAYEALKMCRKVIAVPLLAIFNAGFRLGLHPDHFKDTITIIIKKAGKPADKANSYRPIALLNTIGKVYERLIADRYKGLIHKHKHLLPDVQFGAPGQNTTSALELLNNTIYRGWATDMKVSLLGLDISGAYDHIDRSKLLAMLIDLGIPDWLIRLTWSFLSDRRTYLHMPGYEGGEYWIDIGIPQGSPLSPILFLFYAAPLLTEFLKGYNELSAMIFSYVDDTYIVVTSRAYKLNCDKMADIHHVMEAWARENNLFFSPAKYHVMHFAKPGTAGSNELPDIPGFAEAVAKAEEAKGEKEAVAMVAEFEKAEEAKAEQEAVAMVAEFEKAEREAAEREEAGREAAEGNEADVEDARSMESEREEEAESLDAEKPDGARGGGAKKKPKAKNDQTEGILRKELVILGVKYDWRMSWIPHIEQIENKVRVDLANFQRYVAGTWGTSYFRRHNLYNQKLLAKIAYAAAAWFVHDPTREDGEAPIRWGLTQEALHRLESLQRECLKSLTRARAQTPIEVMENEFHVFPILLKLHHLAMNHRCRQYEAGRYAKMDRLVEVRGVGKDVSKHRSALAQHPYVRFRDLTTVTLSRIRADKHHGMSPEAFEQLWANPDKRTKAIKDCNYHYMFWQAETAFDTFLRTRAHNGGFVHATHRAPFGSHVMKYYTGLTPAQCTMGIMLRTGNIPLNSNAMHRRMNELTDNKCPLCLVHVHTAEHLVMHCPALAEAREHLKALVREFSWEVLLTEDLELTTAWAIRYFGLDQFKYVKNDKEYCFPRTRKVRTRR